MRVNFLIVILLVWIITLSGCMTTWPIVDNLNQYKKWDTYESIRNDEWIVNEEEFNEENIEDREEAIEESEDFEAIEKCVDSWNNDPMIYEDESVVKWHDQFESTEDFCAEFVKINQMFYNDVVWITET